MRYSSQHSCGHDDSSNHDAAAAKCASSSASSSSSAHPKKSEATKENERRKEVIRKMKTASALCLSFFIIEVIGGLMAGSLAVLSDAAHLAADLSAFVVAIAGSHIASLPASDSHTFGLKRVESLAALFSMVSLAILSIGLAIEAFRRMWVILYEGGDIDVDGKLMSSIAFIGVCVNVVLAYVLGEDHVHMVVSWLVCYLLLCPPLEKAMLLYCLALYNC